MIGRTLLEESSAKVVDSLSRASWELLQLSEQRTDRCRHLGWLCVDMG